jgi:hypothetical protein
MHVTVIQTYSLYDSLYYTENSLSLSHTHTHTLTHIQTHTHTLTHIQTHTHTHTHTTIKNKAPYKWDTLFALVTLFKA